VTVLQCLRILLALHLVALPFSPQFMSIVLVQIINHLDLPFGMVWIGNWRTWMTMFLLKPSYNHNGLQLAFFSHFRLNFVANHDVMNITTQSSKHDLACISLQFSVKLWSVQHKKTLRRWQSTLCKTTENLLETPPKNPAKKILTWKSNSKIQLEVQLKILSR